MESKPLRKSDDNKSGRSLKKNIAVAAVAASLGLSLGVPMSDALANEKMDSPPGYSVRDKKNVSSEKMKSSAQSNQGKIESSQGKIKANPEKLESKQFKFKQGQKTESQN